MTLRRRVGLFVGVVLAISASALAFQAGQAKTSVAESPRAALATATEQVLALFRTHRLVAIGEAHNLVQLEAFERQLIATQRFAREVGTVVIEGGNARYQGVVNRYLSGGAVPMRKLRLTWRNMLGSLGDENPGLARLLVAIRRVNASVEPAQRIRAILADPPVDWSSIRTPEELSSYLAKHDRDRFYARTVEREVRDRGRRALLLAGAFHFTRRVPPGAWTAGSLLDQHGGFFNIGVHLGFARPAQESHMSQMRVPTFLTVRDSWLANKPARDSPPGTTLGQLYDGYLYLGASSTLRLDVPNPMLYRDAYVHELIRRHKLAFGVNWRSTLFPPHPTPYPVNQGSVLIQRPTPRTQPPGGLPLPGATPRGLPLPAGHKPLPKSPRPHP